MQRWLRVLLILSIASIFNGPAHADAARSNDLLFVTDNFYSLNLRGDHLHYNAHSPFNPQFFSKPERLIFQETAFVSSKIKITENIRAFFSAASGYVDDSGFGQMQSRLLDGAFSVSDGTQTLRLTLGKQRVTWSQDTIFHPFDLSGPYSFPKNSIGTNKYNDFLREGNSVGRLQYLAKSLSYDFYVANARDAFTLSPKLQGALRIGITTGPTEWTLIGEKSSGYAPKLGLGVSSAIEQSWTLYGEYLYTRSRELPVLTPTTADTIAGADAASTRTYQYTLSDRSEGREKLLLSMRKYFEGGGTGEFGYFHNGHGYGRNEWAQWFNIQHSAAKTIANARSHGDFQGGTQGIGMLVASGKLSREFYLRKNYLYFRLDSLDRFSAGKLESSITYGLDDKTASIWLSLQGRAGRHFLIEPYVLILAKKAHSENAISPLANMAGLNISITF